MLYVTTRNRTDSYTAHRAFREGFAADGGQFAPIRLPSFTKEQLADFRNMSFCESVAYVLNIFYSAHLTAWDVEFAIGKRPMKIKSIARKMTVAEFWHNPDQSMAYSIDRIYKLLFGNDSMVGKPRGWASIAIRIAFVFGTYCELCREGIELCDISVCGEDFESVIATWYARKMGLPVNNIICGTNENCSVWDLLHKGQMDTGAAVVKTDAPRMDQTVPCGIERLIYETLGLDESLRYLQKVYAKGVYRVPAELHTKLSDGLISSVVGQNRIKDLIASAYNTHGYFIDPYMAISYGALQDYRAKGRENRLTLLISEESPAKYGKFIAGITSVAQKDICNR